MRPADRKTIRRVLIPGDMASIKPLWKQYLAGSTRCRRSDSTRTIRRQLRAIRRQSCRPRRKLPSPSPGDRCVRRNTSRTLLLNSSGADRLLDLDHRWHLLRQETRQDVRHRDHVVYLALWSLPTMWVGVMLLGFSATRPPELVSHRRIARHACAEHAVLSAVDSRGIPSRIAARRVWHLAFRSSASATVDLRSCKVDAFFGPRESFSRFRAHGPRKGPARERRALPSRPLQQPSPSDHRRASSCPVCSAGRSSPNTSSALTAWGGS